MTFQDEVHREALHDWLNERPPRESPTPDELLSDPDAWRGVDVEATITALSELALNPPPETST